LESGKAYRFKKGQLPVNKGKKQIEFMSIEAIKKTVATRFKKGNKPHNTYEKDGIITSRIDNSGRPYLYIRTSVGKWELYKIGDKDDGSEYLELYEHQAGCSKDNIELKDRYKSTLPFGLLSFSLFIKYTIVFLELDLEFLEVILRINYILTAITAVWASLKIVDYVSFIPMIFKILKVNFVLSSNLLFLCSIKTN
jgi:hypothetical protein